MIYLISAPPRTGKSLFAIKKIFEYLNQGRFVYTNIAGINIPGVFTITDSLEHPFDWRDLPNDSVIFFDEAQQHLSFGSKKIPKKLAHKAEEILDIGDSFDIHGHFGFDIFLLTQKPNLIRSDLLGFISVHYVMRRKWGQNFATIWEFGEAMTTWGKSTADSALNKTVFRYPKHLYKYYKSAESHTVKKTFPAKYLLFLLIPLALFGTAISKGSDTGFFGLFQKEQQSVSAPVESSSSSPVQITPDQIPEGISYEDYVLLKEEADHMGIQVNQLIDLKYPERKNLQHEKIQADSTQYNIQNPFDYSYLKGSTDRIFAGCIYSKKQGYKAYDNQGTIIHDIDPSVCRRVIVDNDRPYSPVRKNNYESEMAYENHSFQNNQNPDKQDFQKDVEKFQANNQVQPHLQRPMNGSNDSSFNF